MGLEVGFGEAGGSGLGVELEAGARNGARSRSWEWG